jgi:hypothetical protein
MRSRSPEKALRIARARSKIREQRPVNAETRRINRARRQEIDLCKWRNHMRKMLILFKGTEPSTSPWCTGGTSRLRGRVNDPFEPKSSRPTGNHHPRHRNNSTTSHRSDHSNQTRVAAS